MSERPTPRTASVMMEIPSRFDSIWVVPAEVACDLERELGDALRELDEAREALSLANKSLQYCERVIDRLENSNFSLSSALKAINGNPTN